MATEAQRLIGISLTKIAQSRAHRGGVSLHKNLLVATVLQKARYIFMEEAYHMVHTGSYSPPPPVHTPQQQDFQQNYDDDNLVALTPEEAGITSNEASLQEFLQPPCVRCTNDEKDKENVPPSPPSYHHQQQQASGNVGASEQLTYIDLDKSSSNILRERQCLKRRRAVTEWETEEAVLSILPKKSKAAISSPADEEGDDSVFLDEATLFSECVAREAQEDNSDTGSSSSSPAMEIDRITSLVSIFSFGNLSVNSGGLTNLSVNGGLPRSVSTPDLCSAQAKECTDALQQRPYLAMTV